MDNLMTRNWGWVALRGVVALLFGMLTLMNPGITLAALVLLFGAYAFIDGIFAVVTAVTKRRGEPHSVALLIGGIVGIIIGVCTFLAPGITATLLLSLIAAWALLIGFAEISAAVRLRNVIHGEWMLALAGVISVVFGLLLVSRPAVGALAVVLWIGAYALVSGLLLIALAFRLRVWGRADRTSPA